MSELTVFDMLEFSTYSKVTVKGTLHFLRQRRAQNSVTQLR